MHMVGLPVFFVKHKTSFLLGGIDVNSYSEAGIEVNMNHSCIEKKVDIAKILVKSCFISQ